jgi:hypothetical protein
MPGSVSGIDGKDVESRFYSSYAGRIEDDKQLLVKALHGSPIPQPDFGTMTLAFA